jgi:hypothetical protein
MKHLAYWGFPVGLHQDVSLNGFFVFAMATVRAR